MNGTVWKHVIDRWVFVARSPRFYLIFSVFVVIGAVFGPFGVSEAPTMAGRFQLSLSLNAISWSIGILIVVPIRMWLFSKGHSHPKSIIFSSTLANLIILPSFLWTLETWLGRTVDLAQIFEQFLALAALITVIPLFMAPRPDLTPVESEPADPTVLDGPDTRPVDEVATNSIMLKISPNKHGALWALVAQDHYVEVITEHGSELIFMRFRDAIENYSNGCGIRCHRSAWVSKAGFADALRKDNRSLVIQLPNGNEVAVARSREKQVLDHHNTAIAA